MQTKIAHGLPQLARKGIVVVDARGKRAYLVAREAARGFADGVDGFAQIEVENRSLPGFALLLVGAILQRSQGLEQGIPGKAPMRSAVSRTGVSMHNSCGRG
ncbi:MAG: hypothetical protein AB7I36_12340 [Rhodospirillaceae bacterium]